MSALEVDHVTKKLEELEGLPRSNSPVINGVSGEVIERNMQIIAGITIDQLDLIESDLAMYEKVSLCFLLYGQAYSEVALQKLKIALQIIDSSRNIYMVAEWVRTITRDPYMTEKWREILIEALCIAQINHVLIKLGLDLDELQTRFFPLNPEVNLFVHPVLKCLYLLSEQLTPQESEAMICWIDRTYVHTAEFMCPALLELHMLSWINFAIIQIGEWKYGLPNKNMTRFSDVKPVIRYLVENKMLTNYKISLENVVLRVNYTKNNYITMDPGCHHNAKEKLKVDNDQASIVTISSDSVLSVPVVQKLDLTKSSSASKLLSYQVRKENAGHILIINQREFEPDVNKPKESLKPRIGTDFDRNRLVITFSRHGYKPRIRENLNDVEILDEVRQVARDSIDMDSLIVCILSHGKLGTVFSSNNVQVPIEAIKMEMAIKGLKDKPKMIIVQACQEAAESKRSTQQYFDAQIVKNTNCKPEYFQNMFISQSTIEGFVSYRSRENGTWFIQTLCEMIEMHGDEHHISDLFTFVFQEFERKTGPSGERMVPNVMKTLSKNFYLPL